MENSRKQISSDLDTEAMENSRKQISFDLDTKALQIYYPYKSWTNAYNVIKKYMVANDFTWLQGSVYISNKLITSTELSHILSELIEDNKWLNLCMRDCRETDIGREHSKNYLFDKTVNVPTREELEAKPEQSKSSLNDWKNQINELENSQKGSSDKATIKDVQLKKER